MNKLILILTIALLPLLGNAQSSFTQFEDNDEITTVVVNKKLFEMMSRITIDNQEGQDMLDMVKGLKQLKVFKTDDAEIGNEMVGVIDNYLKKSNLSELLRVNDEKAKVKVFIKEGNDDNHVTELLMLVNGINGDETQPETVILSITGDIYLDKISSLINQMNVSGGEHLNKKN
jgi:hypothetical protein